MRRVDLGLLPLLTRRQAVLGGLAALAGCAAPAMDSGASADTVPVGPGSIDHIVVLMMENRSFDHFLGSLLLDEGRDGVDGLQAGMSNAASDGTVHSVEPTGESCVHDPPHGWSSARRQFNDGANDGFVREYEAAGAPDRAEAMRYLRRTDAPVTYALADAYAVCDRYFCSVMGPTWPNRLYGHAGTSEGQTGNDLPDGGLFTMPSVWSRLDEAGISRRYYYTDVPFLALFEGLMTEGRFGLLEDFFDDASDGALPAVSWIDPGFTFNDDHPPHHVGLGQELIAAVYKALAASPLWNRCLLLVTYDEHGGFFDHVPPPTTADDRAAEGFDQLGFRVPSLVIGPYARQGVVSATFDHTSWIRFVCDRFGIAPWTARIAGATSLAEALDTERLAAGEPAPPVELPAFDIDDEAVPDACFLGVEPVSTADRIEGHGEQVALLARHVAATQPGQLRLDVRAVAAEIARRSRA